MVANADGLWLDPAPNGGVDGVAVAPVLHVGFGASAPVVVHRGGRAARTTVRVASYCDASLAVAGDEVVVLEGRKLYVYR